jgi:hypothetical protein
MRRCFIHIGTHRTGTTSLQTTLSVHAEALRNRNYLYPRCGRPSDAPHGHHNLAWEISGDDRFRKNIGGVEELLSEIDEAPEDVILSSEDFGCSPHHPDHFGEFIERLQAHQFEVKLLIYFRNQIDYARSLYFTLFHFGFDRSFEDFLAEILAQGSYAWRDWIWFFCYRDFLQHLERIKGIEVLVRSFDDMGSDSLLADLLSNFAMTPVDLGIERELRINQQMELHPAITIYARERLGRSLSDNERHVIASLVAALGEKPLNLSAASKFKLIEKFEESNEYLYLKYGIAPFVGMERALVDLKKTGEEICIERIFSSSLPQLIERAAQELAEGGSPAGLKELLIKTH